jgi:hypothetical protein
MSKSNQRNGHITREEFMIFAKQVDRRFEQVDRRFEEIVSELKAQREELKAQRHWTEVVVGGFQRRAGRNLEEMVAGCLRVALDMAGIRKEGIRMRQKFVDREGLIGLPGRSYEIDLYASDGTTFFFEIKSVAEPEDVERFAEKAKLASRILGVRKARKVLVTLEKGSEVQRACRRWRVTLA